MADSADKKKGAGRDNKSAAAFRTITEVANLLELPQHVLRFWETKFPQVKPMKRGGGRRYYRPEDVELLRRIRDLLYEDGYTIKGVQKLLRENAGKAPAPADSEADDEADVGTGELTDRQRSELNALLGELESARDALRDWGAGPAAKKA